jgi:hypothetical protein
MRLVKEALGSNVLARQEKLVDLVTASSVVVVAIKLGATTLPWSIRVAASMMLSGWFSVQALLVLLHLNHVDESRMLPILRAARKQQALHDSYVVTVAVNLIVIPTVVYFAYLIARQEGSAIASQQSNAASRLLHAPLWAGQVLSVVVIFASISLVMMGIMAMSITGTFNTKKEVELVIIGLLWLVIVSGLVSVMDKLWDSRNIGSSIVLAPVIWFCLLHPRRRVSTRPPTSSSMKSAVLLLRNLAPCIYVFLFLLYDYDPVGTYKPAWLDYIG